MFSEILTFFCINRCLKSTEEEGNIVLRNLGVLSEGSEY